MEGPATVNERQPKTSTRNGLLSSRCWSNIGSSYL